MSYFKFDHNNKETEYFKNPSWAALQKNVPISFKTFQKNQEVFVCSICAQMHYDECICHAFVQVFCVFCVRFFCDLSV